MSAMTQAGTQSFAAQAGMPSNDIAERVRGVFCRKAPPRLDPKAMQVEGKYAGHVSELLGRLECGWDMHGTRLRGGKMMHIPTTEHVPNLSLAVPMMTLGPQHHHLRPPWAGKTWGGAAGVSGLHKDLRHVHTTIRGRGPELGAPWGDQPERRNLPDTTPRHNPITHENEVDHTRLQKTPVIPLFLEGREDYTLFDPVWGPRPQPFERLTDLEKKAVKQREAAAVGGKIYRIGGDQDLAPAAYRGCTKFEDPASQMLKSTNDRIYLQPFERGGGGKTIHPDRKPHVESPGLRDAVYWGGREEERKWLASRLWGTGVPPASAGGTGTPRGQGEQPCPLITASQNTQEIPHIPIKGIYTYTIPRPGPWTSDGILCPTRIEKGELNNVKEHIAQHSFRSRSMPTGPDRGFDDLPAPGMFSSPLTTGLTEAGMAMGEAGAGTPRSTGFSGAGNSYGAFQTPPKTAPRGYAPQTTHQQVGPTRRRILG